MDYERIAALDANDVKALAVVLRKGGSIDDRVYRATCEALNGGRCAQAVCMAVANLATAKQGANTPRDPVAVFWGILRNQEQRLLEWARRQREGHADE